MENPFVTITRSFSKKVQIAQYEPEEYFCSASFSFFDKPTDKEIIERSDKLWKLCKQEVAKAIKDREESIKSETDGQDAPF